MSIGMKNKKGISLVVLVVTLIVMIIIAGTIILSLNGDKIISKANEAKEKSIETSLKEYLASLSAKWDVMTNAEKKAEKAKDRITYINNKLKEEGYGVEKKDESSFEVSIEGFKFTIDKNGKLINHKKDDNENDNENDNEGDNEKEDENISLVKAIKANNYGDKVKYSANGISDWKIFYNDNNNVWIIASDYIDWTKTVVDCSTTKALMKGVSGDNYKRYFKSPAYPTERGDIFDSIKFTSLFTTNKAGCKSVSVLLKKGYWNDFVDERYADFAIGGPTLEMWVSSWNHKNAINEKSYPYLYTDINESGYYIGSVENLKEVCDEWNIYKGGYYMYFDKFGTEANKDGYYDDLYFNNRNMDCGYWIAAPSSLNSYGLMYLIDYERGRITSDDCDTQKSGLRPVICIKSTVKTKSTITNGVTTWELFD